VGEYKPEEEEDEHPGIDERGVVVEKAHRSVPLGEEEQD
jgi:hypothetical protein